MDGWIRDGWRRRTLLRARGRTPEIGAGTGKNPPLDGPAATREVAGVDFSPKRLAHAPDGKAPLPVILQAADARRLAFRDGSVDTVLATCVFCRVPGPALGTGGHRPAEESLRPAGGRSERHPHRPARAENVVRAGLGVERVPRARGPFLVLTEAGA